MSEMTSTEMIQLLDRLNDPDAARLLTAELTLQAKRESVIANARALADKLHRVAARLEADPNDSINSLGEVQGNGPGLDVQIAVFCAKRDEVNELRRQLARKHPTPPTA